MVVIHGKSDGFLDASSTLAISTALPTMVRCLRAFLKALATSSHFLYTKTAQPVMDSSDLGLDIEQASTEEAMEVEKTTNMNSKYAPVAEQWRNVREDDGSLIIRDVEKSTVESLRNFFYRTFEKEDVIVRSTRQQNDQYTITVRERVDGEYLQNDEEESTSEDSVDSPSTPEETEKAIDDEFFDDKDVSEEENGREEQVSMSGGPMG